MIKDLDLASIRRSLEKERTNLLRRVVANLDEEDEEAIKNLDRADLAQAYASLERDLALQEIEKEQLEQIESALRRLDEGTYGLCTNCGEEIAPGRLEVLPYAAFCVRCQGKLG